MQRKRHINFKLHSIPILLNMKKSASQNNGSKKSNVLYSIPCVKACARSFCGVRIRMVAAFLLAGVFTLILESTCYAACVKPPADSGTISDSGAIAPISGGTTALTTASLSLSKTNMTSNTATPGNIATADTYVTVNVSNAGSYSLTIKVDNANIAANGTTLTAGNVTNDNTWGYKWDNASTYTAPSTTVQTLTVPALSNNSVSFTKNLTFGAKFASNANAGHYKGSGTLSLVATPKATIYTLADLTQMQQLAEGYAPDACENTVIPSGQDYAGPYTLTDVRDNNTYTVFKFKDGKCWMTQNLRLSDQTPTGANTGGRVLNPTTSDISSGWTLPASNSSGFSNNTVSNVYYDYDWCGDTIPIAAYYSWCAATAGTCSSATNGGQNASSSICPKGWKLPTGGTSGNANFYNLFKNMGLTISGSLATSDNTSWGTGDLAKVQGPPYNFAYTGYMANSSGPQYATSQGYWWSRTAAGDSSRAYYLYIVSGSVNPGTGVNNRRSGFAVRCVAE